MISFLLCLAILIVGYFVYGKIVDNTFGPDDRETPAVRINDGVDYVVMPQWKLFLVQLLNIAGLGPIFGAMQGALWGPVVFLWITFGTIFAGGVHDYFSGMMSERNDGASIAEITGKYLGPVMQNVMRVFSVVLLIMVGTVFAVGPAGLIVELCSQSGASGVLTSLLFWLIIILVYYFIATFISIDAVIGKIYPIFGICLIIMAIGVIFGIFTNPAYTIPEIWDHFGSMHPSGTPIWSFMFITVACGAISGFHSTQSPLMARCMKSEKQGHFVFYGAMVCEGVIALIWAAAGCSLYEVTGGLNTGLAEALAMGQSKAIYDVCSKTMGGVGIALAMIGVVVCPITSGDTAFRSARLTLADTDWDGAALDVDEDGTLSGKTLNDKIAAAVAVKSEARLVWNTHVTSPNKFTTWDVQIPGNVDKICITKGKYNSYDNNTEKSIARGGTTTYDCDINFTITFQTNGILHVVSPYKTLFHLELWIDGYHYPTLADLLTQVTAVESSVTDLQVALCELYEEKEEN